MTTWYPADRTYPDGLVDTPQINRTAQPATKDNPVSPVPTLTRKQQAARYQRLTTAVDILASTGTDTYWIDLSRDDTAATTGPTTEAGIYLSQAADDLYELAGMVGGLAPSVIAEKIRSVRDRITFAATAFEEEDERAHA